MIDKDILFTVAELAVALAGLSAIIGVLSTRPDAADRKVNALRLQVMLETCFMVAFAALVPALLNQFNIDSSLLWRFASGIFLCVAIPYEFVARHRTKDLPNMTLTKLNVNTVNWALSVAADLTLIAILLNWVGEKSGAFYSVALFSQLVMAGILFVQFAAEIFSRSGSIQEKTELFGSASIQAASLDNFSSDRDKGNSKAEREYYAGLHGS
jgi:hypothetical protein